ncbi:MAG: ABC transporter permease [Lachnospiraceae bacterium]|nr:ABC transporter permease [Lachnospiraceae bacterium]
MRISDLLKLAFRNLMRRKARTALTIIGVVIGTISIVVMVSIGIGVNQSFDEMIMQSGSMTMIRVQKYGAVYDEEGNYVDSKEQVLDDSTVELIRGIPHVKAVSPVISQYASLYSGKYESGVTLYAMDCESFEAFEFPPLQYGSYPTKEHPATIVLSPESMEYFYCFSGNNYQEKSIDPLTEEVILQFHNYQTHQRKKEFKLEFTDVAMMEQTDNWEYSYNIYMDIDYFRQIWKQYSNTLTLEDRKRAISAIENYEEIKINVDNIDNVEQVREEIEALGYAAYSEMQYLEPLKETSNMLQMVLGAIGSIAMMVSAINIANTMVMSIYERTKEIGVMKVLGCLVRDIKRQFLLEAGLIGLLGGIIGILISYVLSFLINKYGAGIMGSLVGTGTAGELSVIPFWLPFAAAAFGMLVGLLSGYFPARRATRIRAIEAMRTEG